MRPLVGMKDPPASWRIRDSATGLDPSVAEVKERVAADISRLRQWGYELIKHDYSTFDILGRWGFAFGANLTNEGWAFKAGRSRTTAEVVLDLYQVIRTAADKVVVLGCNTISHLTAGMCEASRIGDDTSGKAWDRTRKMGVNSLAFRAAHHGTFYAADADCLGLTPSIPWELNRRWLDLLARSGTPLFVSAQKEATGPEQQKALRQAFALAAQAQPLGEPLDWMHTTCPRQWRLGGEKVEYDWMGAEGCSPFPG
jgi:alpha-galactosidase